MAAFLSGLLRCPSGLGGAGEGKYGGSHPEAHLA